MISIIYKPNRFEQAGQIKKLCAFNRFGVLEDYIRQLDRININELDKYDVIVSGKVVTDKQYFINNNDEIIVTPKIEDPATIGAIFATVAGALGASTAGVIIAAQIGVLVGIGMILATIGYSIYSIVNRPSTPSFGLNSAGGIDESSPTYGWEGARSTRDVGIPIPVIYGEHKTGGNVINEFTSTDGDKNYLNMLIGLCEGEIEDVSSIKVNDNPIANFDGATQSIKYGTNDQTVISNFEDLHNLVDINVEMTQNNSYIYTTVDNDVEAFEIKFFMPSGLFCIDETTGERQSWSVTYKIEYKLTTDSEYTDLGSTTITDKSSTALRRVFRKDGLTAGKYDIRITKTSSDSNDYNIGTFYLSSIDEIKTDDLSYPNTALFGLKLLATEQLSGASPNVTCIVKGKKVSAPYITYGGNPVEWEDYYFDPLTEEFKLFEDDSVCSWDGETYAEQYCANPVWCMKDLITNSRYGLGNFISSDLLDDALFLEMAKHCDERIDDGEGNYEKRFRLDVVIDSINSALDLINQLSATFNAFSFYSSGQIKLKIDKEEDPVQLFGMGNMIEDSFSQTWKTIKDVPNVIEIIFNDAEKDYEQEIVSAIDEEALANGDPLRKISLRIYCTRISQALRVGRYALNVAKCINRTISFKAGIDAIACQVGDVIDVSHDVPQWGFSGRVVSASSASSITIDQSVTIESGKTYKLQIFFSDGTIEEKTVSNEEGSASTITVSTPFSSTPAAYDKYAFGETDIQSKPFRIIEMQRDNKDEVSITASEYDEDVYDDSAVVIPENNYSALSREIPPVTNLNIEEENIIEGDGSISSIVEISWALPEQTNYVLRRFDHVKIYKSEDNGAHWYSIGETTKNIFTDRKVTKGSTYYYAIVSVSPEGSENAIANSPDDSITILGDQLPPDDVTGFEVAQTGNQLRFEWNANTDNDLAKYIIKKGADWESGQIIAEKVDVTYFTYPVGEIGEQTFMIKAVDTTGNESDGFASDTITVTPPPDMSFQVDFDLFNCNLEYKLTDLDLVKKNSHDAEYNRNCLSLTTATTWEELQALNKGWEELENSGDLQLDGTIVASGSYEMIMPLDLGTAFEFKVVLDLDSLNVAGGSITVQIAYSTDGTTFSAWETISAIDTYLGRYIKFKLLFATTDTSHHLDLYDCLFSIQAPEVKTTWGRDVAVNNASGITVPFGQTYSFAPRVIVSIINGVEGIAIVNNKTTTGFDVQVKNLSGVGIATAEIDWEAKGY